jgi:hypothetical protein
MARNNPNRSIHRLDEPIVNIFTYCYTAIPILKQSLSTTWMIFTNIILSERSKQMTPFI